MQTSQPLQSGPHSNRPFYGGLEGLRGVAVLVVLLFHDGYTWVQGGFLGVSTFFTLSGFLITGVLLGEYDRSGRVDVLAFWGRRFRRLMPAAFVTLLGVAAFGALAADAVQHERLLGDGLAALFYTANWWLIATDVGYADLMGSPSPVQHFWSLAIEEQYYVIYPLLATTGLVAAKLPRRALAGFLVVFMIVAWGWMAWLTGTDVADARIYFGTDTRCAELLAGGVLALAVTGRSIPARYHGLISALGVLGLLASAWFWATSSTEHDSLYRGGLAAYTMASVAIIAAAILPNGPVQVALSGRVLRWIGRVSYGIYLVHWPIFLWLSPESTGLDGFALTALRTGLTCLIAAGSYYWLEEPIRRGRRIVSWRRWVAPPAAALVVAIALALASGRTTWRVEPDTADTVARAEFPSDKEPAAINEPPLRILVLGDSIGHNLAGGLTHWAKSTGRAHVDNSARKGCGIARGARIGEPTRINRICDDWDKAYKRRIANFHPDVVLIYSAGFDLVNRQLESWDTPKSIGDADYDRWLRSEYDAAALLFAEDGAHVVWVSPLCMGRMLAPGGNSPLDPERTRRLIETIVEPLAAQSDHVSYVDLFTKVCPDGKFANRLAGIDNLRPDGIHFSNHAARWVGGWLGGQLLEISDREGRRRDRRATKKIADSNPAENRSPVSPAARED
jgi:peptidoglycan/LPS O-acetylase OafA/YrhL